MNPGLVNQNSQLLNSRFVGEVMTQRKNIIVFDTITRVRKLRKNILTRIRLKFIVLTKKE